MSAGPWVREHERSTRSWPREANRTQAAAATWWDRASRTWFAKLGGSEYWHPGSRTMAEAEGWCDQQLAALDIGLDPQPVVEEICTPAFLAELRGCTVVCHHQKAQLVFWRDGEQVAEWWLSQGQLAVLRLTRGGADGTCVRGGGWAVELMRYCDALCTGGVGTVPLLPSAAT